jgi:hypothetical protein
MRRIDFHARSRPAVTPASRRHTERRGGRSTATTANSKFGLLPAMSVPERAERAILKQRRAVRPLRRYPHARPPGRRSPGHRARKAPGVPGGPGPQGAQGPPGPAGPQGPQGPRDRRDQGLRTAGPARDGDACGPAVFRTMPIATSTAEWHGDGHGDGADWLKNPYCFFATYSVAQQSAAQLAGGQCGLTDGSSPGDWRLPTKAEWEATIAHARALRYCPWRRRSGSKSTVADR